MSKLENILWECFLRGDPRISVLESFQSEPYTYVKVFVDDGTHGITVQEIVSFPHPFHKSEALKVAIQTALKKVADLIIERTLAPVIESFSSGPV